MKDGSGADKSDAGDDLCRNPSVIAAEFPRKLCGKHREHRRAETNEHVGAKAGGLVLQFAFETDGSAEKSREADPEQVRPQFPVRLEFDAVCGCPTDSIHESQPI